MTRDTNLQSRHVSGNQFGLKSLLGLTVGAGLTFAIISQPVRAIAAKPDGLVGLGIGLSALLCCVLLAMGFVSLSRFVQLDKSKAR